MARFMLPSLNGLSILVTRPEHQADPLCRLIDQHGGIAIRCPALVIGEPRDWKPALATLDRLECYDLIIFTSVNAVHRAFPLIQERGGIPPYLAVAAIGKATAKALAQYGIADCVQADQGFTSEALLALPRFQEVIGQRIVIIRGQGGRELLTETLTRRGAHVDHAEVYRRERPTTDQTALMARWRFDAIGAVVITSRESLLNLFDMLNTAGQDALRRTPFIVVSARIQHAAEALGCRHVLIAQDASDDAIIATLLCLTTSISSSAR